MQDCVRPQWKVAFTNVQGVVQVIFCELLQECFESLTISLMIELLRPSVAACKCSRLLGSDLL